MKIALIRRQFAATGGAELYLQRLMHGLLQRGHELHLFCEQWNNAPGEVTTHFLGRKGGRSDSPRLFAETVLRLLPECRFDCVFSLERTLKQDVYRAGDGVHAAWLERRKEFASPLKRFFIGRDRFHRNMLALERETFSPANTARIIVNSEMVKHEISQKFRFPMDRIHLVRNGVDTRKFTSVNKQECRRKMNIPDDVFVLLFVGSGWERKGLKYITNHILPALNKTEPSAMFKLLVAGKGNTRGFRADNVQFLGGLDDVQVAYGAADLFLFLPIYEPSANVCFEAMAAGLPVVTTRQNGAGEIIRPGVNGTIINQANNIDQAVEAVRYWRKQGKVDAAPDLSFLSIDRNVEEIIAVLNHAAEERQRLSSGTR
ncbi:MAG: glycosyltransferase family 4 protein [Verrucomicrobiales bacterium]